MGSVGRYDAIEAHVQMATATESTSLLLPAGQQPRASMSVAANQSDLHARVHLARHRGPHPDRLPSERTHDVGGRADVRPPRVLPQSEPRAGDERQVARNDERRQPSVDGADYREARVHRAYKDLVRKRVEVRPKHSLHLPVPRDDPVRRVGGRGDRAAGERSAVVLVQHQPR
eukprot:CAMPEP_0179870558 /NCGR_PEP_ID=MMETSP0982-20121206/20302_1 /TAXON_ID=483367 /ORGANISM="non described non described, Strain CCMP 2436" /LENGTH=172 /DNA_ID=CAMNT_0021761061 /DNA_START=246 /DNA_END=763 /DNA_ORIENTATION=-